MSRSSLRPTLLRLLTREVSGDLVTGPEIHGTLELGIRRGISRGNHGRRVKASLTTPIHPAGQDGHTGGIGLRPYSDGTGTPTSHCIVEQKSPQSAGMGHAARLGTSSRT